MFLGNANMNDACVDILSLLRAHNLGHVVENIVEYAGHVAAANMMQTCR